MPRKCCICGMTEDLYTFVDYHPFPLNPELRSKWFQACKLSNSYTEEPYLCSLHFPVENYDPQHWPKKVLKENAEPRVYDSKWKGYRIKIEDNQVIAVPVPMGMYNQIEPANEIPVPMEIFQRAETANEVGEMVNDGGAGFNDPVVDFNVRVSEAFTISQEEAAQLNMIVHESGLLEQMDTEASFSDASVPDINVMMLTNENDESGSSSNNTSGFAVPTHEESDDANELSIEGSRAIDTNESLVNNGIVPNESRSDESDDSNGDNELPPDNQLENVELNNESNNDNELSPNDESRAIEDNEFAPNGALSTPEPDGEPNDSELPSNDELRINELAEANDDTELPSNDELRMNELAEANGDVELSQNDELRMIELSESKHDIELPPPNDELRMSELAESNDAIELPPNDELNVIALAESNDNELSLNNELRSSELDEGSNNQNELSRDDILRIIGVCEFPSNATLRTAELNEELNVLPPIDELRITQNDRDSSNENELPQNRALGTTGLDEESSDDNDLPLSNYVKPLNVKVKRELGENASLNDSASSSEVEEELDYVLKDGRVYITLDVDQDSENNAESEELVAQKNYEDKYRNTLTKVKRYDFVPLHTDVLPPNVIPIIDVDDYDEAKNNIETASSSNTGRRLKNYKNQCKKSNKRIKLSYKSTRNSSAKDQSRQRPDSSLSDSNAELSSIFSSSADV